MWVFSLFSNFWIKIRVIFFVVTGALFFLWEFRRRAKKQGSQEAMDKVNKETQRVKDEWSKIDNSDVSIDDAINGLRKHKRKD